MAKNNFTNADINMMLVAMEDKFLTKEEFLQFKSDLMDKIDLILKVSTRNNQELDLTQDKVTTHNTRLNTIDLHLGIDSNPAY